MRRLPILLLAILALPTAARAELSEGVKKARNEFEFGRFENAIIMADELIAKNRLFSDDDRVEAYRIAGLARFYKKEQPTEADRARAEQCFLELLRMDPDYQLDPFFTPPYVVTFFDNVRKAHDAELGPLRDAIRKRREEQARREAEERTRLNAPRVVKFSLRTLSVAFLPLGAGQFQNGENGLGFAFAGVQTAALATMAGTYLAVLGLRDPRGTFARADTDTANALRIANWTSIGVFAASWIISSAQAVSRFQPEVEVGSRVSLHGGAPARLSPVVSPLAGGGLLGLQMGF